MAAIGKATEVLDTPICPQKVDADIPEITQADIDRQRAEYEDLGDFVVKMEQDNDELKKQIAGVYEMLTKYKKTFNHVTDPCLELSLRQLLARDQPDDDAEPNDVALPLVKQPMRLT